jgi:hypothetical protein
MTTYLEKVIKEQGMRIQLLTTMVEEMGYQIADIYKELDMVDGEVELTGYDLCECDSQYGHICQDRHRV